MELNVEKKQVDSETVAGDTRKNKYEKENFVPIQEYTGEGFKLRDSREGNLEIAEKHQDEVEEAVKQFFLDEYKTEVKVHNMVAAVDGVTVYVESIGEPHFYTFAIVPVDLKDKEVRTDSVWSMEGQVENGIASGLYAMAYKEEFINLNQYLEEATENHPIVGISKEAIENVRARGYSTPYYFVASLSDTLDELTDEYLKNPKISVTEVKDFLRQNNFNPEFLNISIEFYMEKQNADPEQKILDSIVGDLENKDNIPPGEYSIHLNDNYIDKRLGIGKKENSIKLGSPNKLSKK